ncbi:cadmium resistance transporter-domain-containing protein [Aspergillus arachidicola]|uniref:Cadmium resistance transporter-domain-containing protein n=1 Tax=Aspergillus arachidicola TaxID=656916 RepID=A0A5N6XRB6_9EURO|nr:cadmium resistance transporter-domain-containing protein [Aspergillus arachidicola]
MMHFGATVGEACATFAITNIDDLFVLVTFNAEATTSRVITPYKIVLGQFIGFTIIIAISMIGFGISLVLPPEPIGFLGLLPILLGIWKFCQLFYPNPEEPTEISTAAAVKGVLKVSLITLMNGGDNIGTYIPLFAQVEKAAIAVYIVVYYLLLAVWCLAAYLIMRQKHILAVVQKYVDFILPILYTGLGIFIIIKSNCYPWTIRQINDATASNPGEGTMAGVTTFILLAATCTMAWVTVAKRKIQSVVDVDLTTRDDTPQEVATGDTDAIVR